jgi:hypothetical protein
MLSPPDRIGPDRIGLRCSQHGRGAYVIALGLVLLILGLILGVGILWILGIILIVIGAILWILGAVGRPVGGRTHYY